VDDGWNNDDNPMGGDEWEAGVPNREMRAERDKGQHTTHPQPREKLLVGQNTGRMMMTRRRWGSESESTMGMPHHPPLLQAPAYRVDGGYCRETVRRGAAQTTYHLPPASCVTAHGMDYRWIDDTNSNAALP
jgi:hypothetical protein